MSINKAFVVKNGFEVSTDLILANADTRRVGVGSTNPQYTLDVAGGIGATDFYLTGIGTFVDELNVGLGGTVLTVLGLGNSIGIGTALPAYLLDIRSPVSTGQTALYVQGDVRITGDLSLDDVTLDDATIQDLTVTDTFIVAGVSTFNSNVFINAALNVSGVTTLGSYVDINNSADISGALNVVGLSTLGGYVDINNSVDVGVNLNVVGLTTLGGYVDINNSVDISGNLNISGIATIASVSIVGAALSSLVVTGISTLGVTSISQLNVSGISTLGIVQISSGIITATSGIITYFGDGSNLTGLAGNPTLQTVLNTGNTSTIGMSISGVTTLTTLTGTHINISGICTAQDFDALSDINYKTNILTIENALDKVNELRGVSFDWKKSGSPSYGVIAQELEDVLPELVHGEEPKTVNYNGIIGVLIEAVKELKKEVEELKN
jgi:hypothetical protein